MNVARILQAITFAALKDKDQRRKDAKASPYINHPIQVATLLATDGGISEETVILAAILHDTVEDTETTFEELEQHFGSAVSALVREVTDDKRFSKEERKQLQIEHAARSSVWAKQIKIADKICNVRDVLLSPPPDWTEDRRREYVAWSVQVVNCCRGTNTSLETIFDTLIERARATLSARM